MTGIGFDCPECQSSVTVPPRALLLATGAGTTPWYAYHCPSCAVIVHEQAEERTVAMLIWSGCTATGGGTSQPR